MISFLLYRASEHAGSSSSTKAVKENALLQMVGNVVKPYLMSSLITPVDVNEMLVSKHTDKIVQRTYR